MKKFNPDNETNIHESKISFEKFREHSGSNSLGVWELDFEKKQFRLDPMMRNIFKINDELFVYDYETWWSRVYEDDKYLLSNALNVLQNGKNSYEAEYRHKFDGENYVWIKNYGYVIERFPDGSVKLLKGVYIETTKEKESKIAVEESEKRFRTLFENMSEGVAIHKLVMDENNNPIDYVVVSVNPSFSKHTGIDGTSVNGKLATEIYKVNPPPFLDIYAEVALTGKPTQFTHYAPPLKKHFRISSFSPEKNYFATVFQDVTEQKGLSEALEKRILSLTQPLEDDNSIKFEDIFNIDEIQKIQDAFSTATGVASLITDANGIPLTKPSNFVRLCNDIIRKTDKGLHNCIHSDKCIGKVNPNGPIYQPCLSGGLWDGGTSITAGDKHIANWLVGQILDESISIEKMLEYANVIGADKEEFEAALSEVPIMSQEKFRQICDALYLIAQQLSKLALQNINQARFISQLKKSEAIIQKQVNELEIKNAELERFTYTVSHDLKSPLITIKGFIGMINTDVANQRYDRIGSDMRRISNAADKMQNLLEDLLELSRIGRIIHPASIFSFTDAANEALELLFGVIHSKGVVVNVEENMPVIKADKPRIREVIQNIIENAIKFMGEQPNPKIEIGSKKTEENVIFYIRDNGIGVEEIYLKKIFGLFDKLNPESEGTGIGLAIVKRIIELHKGEIWAESKGITKGTTFYIKFENNFNE